MVGNEEICLGCNNIIGEDYYKCDVCTQKIHLECAGLSSSETRCMPLQRRTLVFCCDDCKTVIKKIPSLVILMEEVKQQLLKLEHQPVQVSVPHIPKYNEVVRGKRPEEVVVIKPLDKQQDSLTTKRAVEAQINPSTIGAEVSRVKFIRDGGIAISCEKAEDIISISEGVKNCLGGKYEVKVPQKKVPKLKIVNIEKKLLENSNDEYGEFIEKLVLQNSISTEQGKSNIKVISTYEDKRRKSNVAIVQTDENVYNQIAKKEVLFIGWRKCRYFEHVNVVQCYKCWRFGHMARECRSSQVICPKCSGNHRLEDCDREVEICVNCKHAKEVLKIPNIDYNHTAFNRKCDAYKRIFEQLQRRVNYPETFDKPGK